MQIVHTTGTVAEVEAGLAIIGAWEGEPLPQAAAGLIEDGDFTGRFKSTAVLYPWARFEPAGVTARDGNSVQQTGVAARRLLLIGLGKRDKGSTERLRQAFAVAAQKAADLKVTEIVIALPEGDMPPQSAQAITEGVLLALYRFDAFKGSASKRDDQPTQEVERITLVGGPADAGEQVTLGETLARGVMLARDLGNEPPLVCTPTRLAEVAGEIAKRGGFDLTVLDVPQMEELGMGGLLGVTRGSAVPPKFIVLEHGKKGQGKTIALVGKGITFDSGGISIKPAANMDAMKMDMMGAGAVLGAMSVLADLRPENVHVVGIIASSENLPSATAFKPGDILKAMNGVTMEILNTDAEGRLVLADALSYAQRFEPDAIIDLATLTGACVIALGNHISGLITNNAELAARVKAAGDNTGELVWELPLLPEYREAVKSKVADIRNSAGRPASAITAGAFLEHFVDERPWVHLDIAGTMSADESPKPYAKQGATGFGVRLLVEFVQDVARA